jgi:hypothetical protein
MERVMPVTHKDITKKAEISHMVGIISRCVTNFSSTEIQGGFKTVAHSLIIDDPSFTCAHKNQSGKCVPTIVSYHRLIKLLSHSTYHQDVNATRVDQAFT